jgi:uncharacterized protein (DUF3084 family)
MKQFLKKYWAIIVGTIIAAFGVAFVANKKSEEKQLDKLDDQIDDTKQQVDIITGKVEVISEQRDAVKTDIKESENDLQVLKQAKDAIKTEKPKTAKQAKENILSKTNKNKK